MEGRIKNRRLQILFLAIAISSSHAQPVVRISDLTNYDRDLVEVLDTTGLGSVWLLISKKDHITYLNQGDSIIKAYPIVMSDSFMNDKKQQGDLGVPEGVYYITSKPYKDNIATTFYRFCPLNYPNEQDAEHGLRTGIIDSNQYRRILSANRRRANRTPPTPLGSAIGIHGSPDHSDTATAVGDYIDSLKLFIIWDWTLGCIGFNNYDFKEFIDLIKPWQTPIFIKKETFKDSISEYRKLLGRF